MLMIYKLIIFNDCVISAGLKINVFFTFSYIIIVEMEVRAVVCNGSVLSVTWNQLNLIQITRHKKIPKVEVLNLKKK